MDDRYLNGNYEKFITLPNDQQEISLSPLRSPEISENYLRKSSDSV